MPSGIVTRFDPKKGWGFITVTSGDAPVDDLFAHQNEIKSDGFRYLVENEEVEFEIEQNEKGFKATNIVIKSPRVERRINNVRTNNNRSFNKTFSQPKTPANISQLEYRLERLEGIVNRFIEVASKEDADIDPVLTAADVRYILASK